MFNTRKNPIFKSHPSFILNAKREDLKPQVEWVEDRANHMLIVQLPGFKREEIRVQLNNAGKLFIRGSRFTADNKFIDIDQSFDVPKDVITNKISGKFEDGRLTLILPKNVITEAEAITKVKKISNEAKKEEVSKKEATEQEEPKQEEEKHEQGKIEEEKKDGNVSKGKTTSNEAMQNETNQKEKSTITEAVASFLKDAKSQLTEGMHSQPTQGKEKELAATDTIQNDFDSKPKIKKMPKIKFDNSNLSNKDEDAENPRTKTDEGFIHQEEKKVEKAIEEMKENGSDKVKVITNEVKSNKEKRRERMQRMKLKMNEICKDTPEQIRKKLRRGEDGWLNSKYIDGAVERINRNKNIIAIAVMAFSIGLYVSHRLKARRA